MAYLYGFVVDQAVPPIRIPLAGADEVMFNLGDTYHETFRSLRFFHEDIDCTQLPVRFDRYQSRDQERIQRRMSAIMTAHAE